MAQKPLLFPGNSSEEKTTKCFKVQELSLCFLNEMTALSITLRVFLYQIQYDPGHVMNKFEALTGANQDWIPPQGKVQ